MEFNLQKYDISNTLLHILGNHVIQNDVNATFCDISPNLSPRSIRRALPAWMSSYSRADVRMTYRKKRSQPADSGIEISSQA